MDDLALIQAFIQSFIRGEALLLSNSNLRVEPIQDMMQLTAKKEGLIATTKRTSVPSVLVKRSSPYGELMHQGMMTNGLFPVGEAKDGFYSYQHRTIPQGYQLNCTDAMSLWRAWWRRSSRNQRLTIPMNLLLFVRGIAHPEGTWQPIRDIICSHGTLFVKTLGVEVAIQGSEAVVWLQKISAASPANSDDRGVRPDLRGCWTSRLKTNN